MRWICVSLTPLPLISPSLTQHFRINRIHEKEKKPQVFLTRFATYQTCFEKSSSWAMYSDAPSSFQKAVVHLHLALRLLEKSQRITFWAQVHLKASAMSLHQKQRRTATETLNTPELKWKLTCPIPDFALNTRLCFFT